MGEDNMILEEVPTLEEVRRVVFAIDGESAAGPDGFTGKFFTFAWDIIAQDVHKAIVSFFCGAKLPRFITSTSIVLIPKDLNPQDFSKFRPISIGKKARGGNVALKLDMVKAYDRMSWTHVIHVLQKFGFGERFIDMVWRLLSNVWFSIIINGMSRGFFKSSRGLRQGDPLSPMLFVIGAEVLSRGLNNLAQQVGFVGFRVPRGCPTVTHLAFADDVIIFWNGSTATLKAIMQVLGEYQRSLGQLVNAHKSGYLVYSSLSPARRRVIERVMRFSRRAFPFRNLGFPLYIGRCKASYMGEIGQALVQRIMSWKSKLLSKGGKLTLIKHVLMSIPVHLLSAAVLPASVFKMLEKVQDGGSCHFWYDNWLGSGALFLKATVIPALSFKDFIVNGKWSTHLLSRVLPLDLLPSVLLHSVPRGGRADEFIWSLTSSGKFTLASAFEEVRQTHSSSFVHSQIWHRRIPSKISFFMLRLLCGRLPFPDVLCRLGFQMPSKCLCCPNGAIETVEHVFSEGQIAKAVWNYFASMCGLTQHIWRARNGAVFEGTKMQPANIYQAVISDITSGLDNHFNTKFGWVSFPRLYDWSGQQGGGIRVEVVRWRAKETGCLTLNTDSCSKGKPGWSGGGGVLRDSLGRPIVAFSAFFGKRLSLHAEALALLTGLQLCVEKGFANVEIQSDSQVLVGILQRRFRCPWRIQNEVDQI
ncbi:uncharacterized protein [Coffea arabica]|uniref:Reverse transcriptase domain-containing protein n=1 Tax=Coffea arabica TaxID=13443 RepID=A0ABM4W401_COFAR